MLRLLGSVLGFGSIIHPATAANFVLCRPTNGRISEMAKQRGGILSCGSIEIQSNLVLQPWRFVDVENDFKGTNLVSRTPTKVVRGFGFRSTVLMASMADPANWTMSGGAEAAWVLPASVNAT
ncbi:hypothetical protein ACLB2K_066153 [Fragaria x ananassa]